MKAIMLMFDSLNRHMLPPYGCDWIHAPNFARLAERTVTFDSSYVCSMPCMPARRDLHTGRANFLHRSWGPLEPFDDSLPELLREGGVSSHFVTDHYHYFEDGGCTYHTRYDTWQFFRGQEGDPWMGQVASPVVPPHMNGKGRDQDWINRQYIQQAEDFPQAQTLAAGLDFLERNHEQDNWFLQIETFDPHEPFYADRDSQQYYERAGEEPIFDWPAYADVKESPEEVERARHNYAALLTQCDTSVGKLLDAMDKHGLWEDTMLIVWTDHGFLLGEHHRWAKNMPKMWNEIAHTPFFIWDPRVGKKGERRDALVQPSIDLAPTLLRFFGMEPTADMRGKDLAPVLANNTAVREAAIFGYHNQPVHVTDGQHLYMRYPRPGNGPLNNYTLMPTAMRNFFDASTLQKGEMQEPLPFTKEMPVMRYPHNKNEGPYDGKDNVLFDQVADHQQESPLQDSVIEERMLEHLRSLLAEYDAMPETYERLGLIEEAG